MTVRKAWSIGDVELCPTDVCESFVDTMESVKASENADASGCASFD